MVVENAKNRKLAAILFADGVGYATLMLKDEEGASAWLKQFQNDINRHVEAFDGQIVNFYGDGALSIFQSPLEAMCRAIELQSGFYRDPQIPVCIGLHRGTVVTRVILC